MLDCLENHCRSGGYFCAEDITEFGNYVQSDLNISKSTLMLSNAGMDIQDIRRKNLRRIIDERFEGVDGRFADYIKRPRPNISQLLAGAPGRPFGERLARYIENTVGLTEGYLDNVGESLNLTEEAAKVALDYMQLRPESQAKIRYYITVALEMEAMEAKPRFSTQRNTQ